MYRKKDLLTIIDFGKEKQLDIAQEECAELIQAISKWKRNRKEADEFSILEEIADVRIMLEQLILMFNINDELLQEKIDYKINRQLRRIEVAQNSFNS